MTTWTSPPDPDLDRDPFDRHLQPIAHPCPRPDRHGPHQWRPRTLTGGLRCLGMPSAGPWTGRGATNSAPDDSRTVRPEEKP